MTAHRPALTVILDNLLSGKLDEDGAADEIEKLYAQKKTGKPNDVYPLAEALAYVCKMDLSANRGLLFREAKLLLAAGATVETIRQHYNGDPQAFWNRCDWRGQKGQRPTPAQIRQTWGQWNGEQNDSTSTYQGNNSRHQRGNEITDEGARVAAILARR